MDLSQVSEPQSGTAATCQGCGAPQPSDVKFEQVQGQAVTQDETLKKIVEAGPDIHCPYCGARNPGSAKVFVQCGGDLEKAHGAPPGRCWALSLPPL